MPVVTWANRIGALPGKSLKPRMDMMYNVYWSPWQAQKPPLTTEWVIPAISHSHVAYFSSHWSPPLLDMVHMEETFCPFSHTNNCSLWNSGCLTTTDIYFLCTNSMQIKTQSGLLHLGSHFQLLAEGIPWPKIHHCHCIALGFPGLLAVSCPLLTPWVLEGWDGL